MHENTKQTLPRNNSSIGSIPEDHERLMRSQDFDFDADPLSPQDLRGDSLSSAEQLVNSSREGRAQSFKPMSLNRAAVRNNTPKTAQEGRRSRGVLNPQVETAFDFKRVGAALGFAETKAEPRAESTPVTGRYDRLSQIQPQSQAKNAKPDTARLHFNPQETTDFQDTGSKNSKLGSRETLGELSRMVLKDREPENTRDIPLQDSRSLIEEVLKKNRGNPIAVGDMVTVGQPQVRPNLANNRATLDMQSASMGSRFMAFCIDCAAILFLTAVVLVGGIFIASQLNVQLVVPNDLFIRFDGLFLQLFVLFSVVFCCYQFVFNYLFQQTPGAFALNLRLQTQDSEPITFKALSKRTLLQLLSLLILPLYLWVPLNKKRRALHDWVSACAVQSYK